MSDTASATVGAMTPREQQLGSIALGICFAVIMVVSALRMRQTPIAAAAETTVVTAFYSLICATSCLRALYFLLPPIHHTPPVALEKGEDALWFSTLSAESLVTLGSLTLFSIFILILVYWADILRKYYTPGARRSAPMRTFGLVTGALAACAAVNVMLCVIGIDSTEGLVLGNAIVLSVTSIICVTEMTIFSRKFQHVLQTLGAINQVSTEAQVQRIVWITVTGNVFFLSRAVVELVLSSLLVLTWWRTGTVQRDLSDTTWDILCGAKYGAEVAILALMLHILQSRFQQSNGSSNATNGIGYQKVPEVATTDTTPSAAGMSV